MLNISLSITFSPLTLVYTSGFTELEYLAAAAAATASPFRLSISISRGVGLGGLISAGY